MTLNNRGAGGNTQTRCIGGGRDVSDAYLAMVILSSFCSVSYGRCTLSKEVEYG